MVEAVGAIIFYVKSGATPVAEAKVYMNSPGMPIYEYLYKGYTNAYGSLGVWNLPIGTNKYMISKTGYNTATGAVVVYANVGTNVNVDMVRTLSIGTTIVGNLNIISNQPGACVYINDALQDMSTPVTIADLPEGNYAITLAKDGYNDYFTLATITGGQTATISANLVPL